MIPKAGKLQFLCVASFLLLASPIRGDVDVSAPRAVRSGMKVAETIAETKRNYVHMIRDGAGELYTLDTDTGQFVAATKLRGAPSMGASMCFSLDETLLYVPLPSSQKIQIISLATLATIDVINVGIPVGSLAAGFDGKLYTTDGDALYQVDPTFGGSRFVGDASFLYSPYLKADPAGRRLFLMERGLSGGGEMLEEFTIVGGARGLKHAATHFDGKANDKDFEIDLENDSLYATAGGVYGINLWRLSTRSQSFWPYGEAYGTGVAHVPGSPYVYGSAGLKRIRRFEKSTGVPDATFDIAGDPWFVDRSLQVTPNGNVFYGTDTFGNGSSSIGVLGIASIAPLPTPVPAVDAGADRTLPTELSAILPNAVWSKLSGPGPVEFTSVANGVRADFSFGGTYVLRAATSADPNANSDRVTLEVLARRPRATMTDSSGTKYLEVTYPRFRAGTRPGISFHLTVSTNMAAGSWHIAGEAGYPVQTISQTPIDQTDLEWVTDRLLTPLAEKSAVFVKTEVVYGP